MGTTLTALQGNAGVAVDYVVAIEGWPTLLCSGSPTAALTAWTGTDWEEAVGGLSVTGQIKQSIDPWRPFGEASTITLSVVPCPGQTAGTDRFGEDVWKRSGGTATDVTTSVDCNDTSLVVQSASAFGASGTLYLENEAIAYSSKTSNTFTISTRGKWSPFTTESAARFAHPHRLTDANSANVKLPPEATTIARGMVGRWVGVWIHRRLGSVLDTKAEAHLAWAGRIRDVEESEAGATVLTCESALASINDTMILRDQYTARVAEGIWLAAGTTFSSRTARGDATPDTGDADDIVVVASGASGFYEVNQGIYTVDEIATYINAWLSAEYVTTNSLFNLTYSAYVQTADGLRPRLYMSDPGGGAANRLAVLEVSDVRVAKALGWGATSLKVTVPTATGVEYGTAAPMRLILFHGSGLTSLKFYVEEVRGTWIDQTALLPVALRGDGSPEGVVKVGDLGYAVAWQDGADAFFYVPLGGEYSAGSGFGDLSRVGFTVEEEGDLPVVQVLYAESSFTTLLRQMLSSTGTNTFNSSYDVLSESIGCGVPHSLIDSLIDTDLASVESADATLTVVVDKPTRFAELFAADLIVRKSFITWRNGQFRLATWQTPTADYATVALTETNKHAPIDHRDKQRASVFESDAWMRNVVKLKYGRRPDGTYLRTLTLEDGPSVRRHGAKPITIELRNVAPGQSSYVSVDLISGFTEWMPVLSRPQARVRRTMSRQLFETATAGAQATITDEHIRDWTTGLRGITTEPGLVVSEWHDWGGATHGEDGAPSVRGPMGEVELLVYPTNVAVYVPCAQVDETQTNAGYDAGTTTLTCYAHKHSESSEVADATRFVADDAIRIVEIDPADPAAPTTWDRVVQSQTGNTIVLTSALSSPAWDSAKRYRVIYDTYADCEANQTTKCFQADDADGLIADTASPFELSVFNNGQSAIAYTSAAYTDLPSRHATLAYGDGVGLDVGYELDIANLCNNLIGYKTAPQCPRVYSEERTWTAGGTWLMVECGPVYVGAGVLTWIGKTRKLYVGPRMKVSSGTGSVRVSLLTSPPSGASLYDVTRSEPVVSTTFTTTSTSYVNKTAVALDIAHLPLVVGLGWLLVEINANTSYAGMHTQYVGPPVAP